jgi:hypothetical protein
MRSNNYRNRQLGQVNAQVSAEMIARTNAGIPSITAISKALHGLASRYWRSMSDALRDWPTVTCVLSTRVTGGDCGHFSPQRPGRHADMCRLAAR